MEPMKPMKPMKPSTKPSTVRNVVRAGMFKAYVDVELVAWPAPIATPLLIKWELHSHYDKQYGTYETS